MNESIGQEFMRRTQPFYVSQTDQMTGKTQPPLELEVPENAKTIPLPKAEDIHFPEMDVRAAIDNRVSVRRYAESNLSLEELAYLIWCTQGIKQITSRPVTMRTVPSAGARHAFETYLLVKRVDGLEPGLYRYVASQHTLIEVDASVTIHEKVSAACFSQKMVDNSAVTFIWVAILERMAWRYGERGFRYLHLDAGHVCQNLYLAGETIDVGVCAIAAFEDNDINTSLHLDGKNQFAIYLASTGKKIDHPPKK
ncbi:MAG: SagB/ThcOx family dehydrogenase [Anaerolineaceae bacterium]|nr:SagB/ThcOx family dehydrogenase [Anaerolineaceae bacterium]